MINFRLLLAALAVASTLAGCGGIGSPACGGADFGVGNAAYAGSYSGTYHNEGQTSPKPALRDLSFVLALSATGMISGTVTEAGSGRTADVHGSMVDWTFACSSDQTQASVQFTFPSETERTVGGSRPVGQAKQWAFTGRYSLGNEELGTGLLVLMKV